MGGPPPRPFHSSFPAAAGPRPPTATHKWVRPELAAAAAAAGVGVEEMEQQQQQQTQQQKVRGGRG